MNAPRLIIFSGAGLSAESGLSTFRGASGQWEGVPLDIVCNYATWRKNFREVHAFYDARRTAAKEAKPNAGHQTLAQWQQRWPDRVHIITQNVDRLLEEAGCNPVLHLHGDARLMHCVTCDHHWEISDAIYDQSGCPKCGQTKTVKPGVVFFGEPAPNYEKLFALAGSLRSIDTALVVGTSGTVLPADQLFGHSPAHSILVNLEPGTAMNECAFTERHYGPATQLLPELTEFLTERMEAQSRHRSVTK